MTSELGAFRIFNELRDDSYHKAFVEGDTCSGETVETVYQDLCYLVT